VGRGERKGAAREGIEKGEKLDGEKVEELLGTKERVRIKVVTWRESSS
jgi:hypothetical protein